jgi:23S rRNA pseudouridine1911/1915/1917 synthase
VRLDLALIKLHPELSRRKAREVIEKGQVELEGRVQTAPGLAVHGGERITWDPNRKALRRTRSSLPLLYADDHLVIVDKPAGLLSVPTTPGGEDEDTAFERVRDYARHRTPRAPYVGIVHRIDKETSGALAFALTPPAREGLRALFRAHHIERTYLALVSGEPPSEEGKVDRPIHDVYAGGRRRVAAPGEPSHPAVTFYKVRERFALGVLLEVTLETGRQHQIRVHLQAIGLPILGDRVYGREEGFPRTLLHARSLAFVHPITGERVRGESPVPADFVAALAKLRARKAPPGPAGAPREAPRRGRPPGTRAPGAGTRSRSPAPRPKRRGRRP